MQIATTTTTMTMPFQGHSMCHSKVTTKITPRSCPGHSMVISRSPQCYINGHVRVTAVSLNDVTPLSLTRHSWVTPWVTPVGSSHGHCRVTHGSLQGSCQGRLGVIPVVTSMCHFKVTTGVTPCSLQCRSEVTTCVTPCPPQGLLQGHDDDDDDDDDGCSAIFTRLPRLQGADTTAI